MKLISLAFLFITVAYSQDDLPYLEEIKFTDRNAAFGFYDESNGTVSLLVGDAGVATRKCDPATVVSRRQLTQDEVLAMKANEEALASYRIRMAPAWEQQRQADEIRYAAIQQQRAERWVQNEAENAAARQLAIERYNQQVDDYNRQVAIYEQKHKEWRDEQRENYRLSLETFKANIAAQQAWRDSLPSSVNLRTTTDYFGNTRTTGTIGR